MARHLPARTAAAALFTVALLLLGDAAAHAAPTVQRVRIEGRASTLFEGPILTDGHAVQASSDRTPRRCDATNNGANPTPGATPTAAADDAMRLTGRTFDAQWYPGFDDYFIQQFGPDREDPGTYAYWGILVNGIYTSVGGCQYRLNAGDVALWAYDAFTLRNLLRLDGPAGVGEPTADVEGGAPTAPAQQVFSVGLGEPFAVTTVENEATGDIGAPGYRRPVGGIRVAPVQTAADGTQTILSADPAAVTTDGAGRASIAWPTPGWKRIKAEGTRFVPSNRLDVCVRDAAGNDCGPVPADVAVRAAPAPTVAGLANPPGGSGSLAVGRPGTGGTIGVGNTSIGNLRLTTDGNPTALVGVRWTVLGPPLKAWRIEYRQRGVSSKRWRTAKSGTTQTSALLDLPVGRFVDIRIRFTPAVGSAVTRSVGRVVVPVDDRVRGVRFTSNWARDRDPRAWRQTLTRMRRGAIMSAVLHAGRPTLVIRAGPRPARVEVRFATGRPQRLLVPARKDGRTILVSARAQRTAGTVRVRVVSGTVQIDGVAARS